MKGRHNLTSPLPVAAEGVEGEVGVSLFTLYLALELNDSLAARLDQDGDEIPTDEEEEYERNRAHMRERAHLLSSRFTNRDETPYADFNYSANTMPPPPPPYPRLSSVFTPTTLIDTLPFPDDDGHVRINLGTSGLQSSQSYSDLRLPHWGRTRARRSTISPIRELGSSAPFHASPIPWTAVDLTPTPQTKTRSKKIIAKGRYNGRAPLAGR